MAVAASSMPTAVEGTRVRSGCPLGGRAVEMTGSLHGQCASAVLRGIAGHTGGPYRGPLPIGVGEIHRQPAWNARGPTGADVGHRSPVRALTGQRSERQPVSGQTRRPAVGDPLP